MFRVFFFIWLVGSLLVQGIPCFCLSLIYRVCPLGIVHRGMWWLYENWVGGLSYWVKKLLPKMELVIKGQLPTNGSYILISNHYSWLDILVLYALTHKKVPSFVFVMKRSLIWVPMLGVECWGLGHPLLRRDRTRKNGVLCDLLTLQEAARKAQNYQYGLSLIHI